MHFYTKNRNIKKFLEALSRIRLAYPQSSYCTVIYAYQKELLCKTGDEKQEIKDY
jgi:hypothetical protein